MRSLSFILNGENVTQETADQLSQHFKQLNSMGIVCEYLLYRSTPPDLAASPGVYFVVSKHEQIAPFYKAIVSSTGDRLIVTTVENAIADKGNEIARSASTRRNFLVAVPAKRTEGVLNLVGIRVIKRAPFIVATRDFATSYPDKLLNSGNAIPLANQLLSLILLPQLRTHLPDVVIKRKVYIRPYKQIFKRWYRSKKERAFQYYDAKRANYLSGKVPTVTYSDSMPVFIICHDRFKPLKKLVDWLEDEGMHNIYLVDNASTYPPLLEYYDQTPYEVIRLNANIGHTSPWVTGIVSMYAKDQPYIVTDPDVIPAKGSHGAVERFCELLTKYPERRKVGFGLKINDLPDHYELKKHVIAWEKRYWSTEKEPGVYDAEIDTTFAVYRKDAGYVLGPSLRTGGKYVARHEPWYIDSANPSEEIRYYRSHADKEIGSWGISETEATDTYLGNLSAPS